MFHDFHCKTVFLIPGDSRLIAKMNEKMERYTDIKIELQRMWKSLFCNCVTLALEGGQSRPWIQLF